MHKLCKAYKLELSDGQVWQITGTKETQPWLQKFATILELKIYNADAFPKLNFLWLYSNQEKKRLASNGWKAYDIYPLRYWSHPDKSEIFCELGFGHDEAETAGFFKMSRALYPIYQGAQDAGGFPFHAGLVECNGQGFLLAAPCETGKSTCCRRLPPPWNILSDDQALITRVNKNKYHTHPLPTWSDYILNRPVKTYNVEKFVPLSAIFFLEQAKKDEVVPIGRAESAIYVYQSALWICYKSWSWVNHEEQITLKKKLFDNSCQLAREIPSFNLRVSLTGRFWEEMEKVLNLK